MPLETWAEWKKVPWDDEKLTFVEGRGRSLTPTPLYFQNCWVTSNMSFPNVGRHKEVSSAGRSSPSNKLWHWCLRARVFNFSLKTRMRLIFSAGNNPCLVNNNQKFRMLKFLFLYIRLFTWKTMCLRKSTVVNTSRFVKTNWKWFSNKFPLIFLLKRF